MVQPKDIDAVAAAMTRMLENAAERIAMGAAGRVAVETHFNWDRVARQTLEFVQQVVRRTGGDTR